MPGMMVLETQNELQIKRTQKMLPRNRPDRIRIAFDDTRLVANAGLLLPATGPAPGPAPTG